MKSSMMLRTLRGESIEVLQPVADFSRLLDTNPHPVYVYDLQNLRLLAVNEAALRAYGYSREELLAMTMDQLSPAEERVSLRLDLHTGEWTHPRELHQVTRDGQVLDVKFWSHPIEWQGVSAMLVVAVDITHWKQAATQLDTFFALSQDMLAISDRDGRIRKLNPVWEKTFGYPIETVVGRSIADFAHPEDAASALKIASQMTENQSLSGYLIRARRSDGTYLTLECHACCSGGLIYTIARDVTAQRKNEARLRDLSHAVENNPTSVVITDISGNIEYVNPKLEQLTGYKLDEVKGKNPRILKSGQTSYEEYRRLWETILAGGVWQGEFKNLKKDGTPYLEHASISPVRDEQGVIRHFVAVKEDITEKRALEEQLLQAQKMEAIGQLAGGIAHDFNNLLTIINGYGHLLRAHPGLEGEALQYIDNITQAGERAAALTRQLLMFSRQQMLEQRVFDLGEMAANLEQFYRRVLPQNIELLIERPASPATIASDPVQVEQAIMNLVVNARDAMHHGGLLRIRVDQVTQPDLPLHEIPGLPHGSYIRLTITDSGEGMTEEVQRHIFEPFFTTKPMGKGTGLGLSTVYGIVRRSNGWIYVDSHPGKGSTFTILMPEAARHPQDQSPSSRHPVGILGDESVLLIEDSEEVRRLTALHLKALGYAVIEAATGEDAIAIADQRGGEFDLVLADVMLPGKSGFDAARQIQARFPHVAVLFFSGYAGDTAAGQGPVEAAGLLPKPFTPEELGGRIRAALRKARNQIRIIVADDEAGIRELLRDFLSSEGYLVETARDGKEVLDQFAAGAVDLFLMDLVMPVKEGIETIIELRRRTPATPIIAMSGAFGGEFLNTAQILGARATLLKPISKPLLLKTVRDVLCAQRSASTSHPN